MTELTYQRDPAFVAWLSDRVNAPLVPEMTSTLTAIRDGQIVAVVGYTNWTAHNVEMLFALDCPKYAFKRLYRAMYEYPFAQPEITRVSGIVDCRNTHSINLHGRIGYEREALLKDWLGSGQHAILFRMTRERAKQQRLITE